MSVKHSISSVSSMIAFYEVLAIKYIHLCTRYVAAIIRKYYLW